MNSEDGNLEHLKKPIFINSSLSKENEAAPTKKENESENNKIPITGLLNVPLNKINEKIISSKENYVQSHLQNLNDTHNKKISNSFTDSKTITENESTKQQEKDTKNHVDNDFNPEKKLPNEKANPGLDNNSNNASSLNNKNDNYHNVPYQANQNKNQYYNYYNQNKNVNFYKNRQNVSDVNNYYSNSASNNQHTPINMNSQFSIPNNLGNSLTNYYANTNHSQNMMHSYYSQQNNYTAEIPPNHDSEEIDLKQFTDKLNINAKVFVPKNVKHILTV